MARCPPSGVDLVSTPEHLRPGFRGRARRYNPNDFGLTDNEEWRHPRMFRDMTCKYLNEVIASDYNTFSNPNEVYFVLNLKLIFFYLFFFIFIQMRRMRRPWKLFARHNHVVKRMKRELT